MSKLLKFKQALSLNEATAYLHKLTGETPTNQDYEDLFYYGHITPIIGYRESLYGFTEEDFIKLKDGNAVKPSVFSYIGVPANFGGEIDGVEFIYTTTVDGEALYFAKRNHIDIFTNGEKPPTKWLSSLDTLDKKNWSIPTFQVHDIATIINSDVTPPHPASRQRLTIEINKTPGYEGNVSAIHGLKHLIHAGESDSIDQRKLEPLTPAPSYKLAIAALLEISKNPRQTKRNQAGIIDEILEHHQNRRGLGKRNLEDIFAAANKAMADAE